MNSWNEPLDRMTFGKTAPFFTSLSDGCGMPLGGRVGVTKTRCTSLAKGGPQGPRPAKPRNRVSPLTDPVLAGTAPTENPSAYPSRIRTGPGPPIKPPPLSARSAMGGDSGSPRLGPARSHVLGPRLPAGLPGQTKAPQLGRDETHNTAEGLPWLPNSLMFN